MGKFRYVRLELKSCSAYILELQGWNSRKWSCLGPRAGGRHQVHSRQLYHQQMRAKGCLGPPSRREHQASGYHHSVFYPKTPPWANDKNCLKKGRRQQRKMTVLTSSLSENLWGSRDHKVAANTRWQVNFSFSLAFFSNWNRFRKLKKWPGFCQS